MDWYKSAGQKTFEWYSPYEHYRETSPEELGEQERKEREEAQEEQGEPLLGPFYLPP